MDERYKLTAEEFISIWKGEKIGDDTYKGFYKEGSIDWVNEASEIHSGDKRTWAIFTNVEVTGIINLYDESTYGPIKMNGVYFHNAFRIQKGLFENFQIGSDANGEENYFKKGLTFTGGTFPNWNFLHNIKGNPLNEESDICFYGGDFNTRIAIWFSKNLSLEIDQGVFAGGISLSGTFRDVFVSGGTYKADIIVEDIYCYGNFQILGSPSYHFGRKNIYEWGLGNYTKSPLFENAGIHFKGITFIEHNLLLSNLKCLYFKVSESVDYTSGQNIFINAIHLMGIDHNVFLIASRQNSILVNSIYFTNCTILKDQIVRIDDISLNYLQFEGLINTGNISLNSITPNKKQIPNVFVFDTNHIGGIINQALAGLLPVIQSPQLIIYRSNFGNAVFINCIFLMFNFKFRSSKINDIFLAGTEMPANIDASDKDFYQHQLGYGQLKKAYSLRGDVLKSQEFYTLELDSYRKYLKKQKGKGFDRVNLLLNALTSKHGLSYGRALLLILVSNAILYFSLCMSLGFGVEFKCLLHILNGPRHLFVLDLNNLPAYKSFFSLLAYFFTYLNPLHKNDFLKSFDIEWTPLSEFIDSVSRIILPYLIYQFIQAFRRYGRSI